jgi:hypothetical protein
MEKYDMSDDRLVLDVPEAGAKLGLGRNASYAAAKRGEIPTIRIGRLLRVPVRAMERLLDQPCRDVATAEQKKSD